MPLHVKQYVFLREFRFFVRHLLISHNAPYLPFKILHKHCFQFLLGRLYYPGELKNKGYAKFWGANKVHYGRCASGELCTNNLGHKQRTLKTLKNKEKMAH